MSGTNPAGGAGLLVSGIAVNLTNAINGIQVTIQSIPDITNAGPGFIKAFLAQINAAIGIAKANLTIADAELTTIGNPANFAGGLPVSQLIINANTLNMLANVVPWLVDIVNQLTAMYKFVASVQQ